MGRICPILNHPLNDGVLIEDEALVNFIQKRNVDFLANELVCRSCKHEVTKLYNKKLRKAIELHRSRYHEGSISTLKTSKDSASSGASTTSEHSVSSRDSQRKGIQVEKVTHNVIASRVVDLTTQQQKGNNANASGDSNQSASSKAENQINLANTQNSTSDFTSGTGANNFKNVTIRKRTIKDFLTPKPKEMISQQGGIVPVAINATGTTRPSVHNKSKAILQPVSPVRKRPLVEHVTHDTELEMHEIIATTRISNVNTDSNSKQNVEVPMQSKVIPKSKIRVVTFDDSDKDDDVNRRFSQEPTTSKAAAAANSRSSMANSNKRPLSALIDSDDAADDGDDQPLSLNAYNGTRLPHIQPLPPKRKSQPEQPRPIVYDIMDDYIKDITGG